MDAQHPRSVVLVPPVVRFRAFKGGNPLRRSRSSSQRFAWLPKRLDNGTYVWFEWYTRRRDNYGYAPK